MSCEPALRELEWRLAEEGFSDVQLAPQVRLSRGLDATYSITATR